MKKKTTKTKTKATTDKKKSEPEYRESEFERELADYDALRVTKTVRVKKWKIWPPDICFFWSPSGEKFVDMSFNANDFRIGDTLEVSFVPHPKGEWNPVIVLKIQRHDQSKK